MKKAVAFLLAIIMMLTLCTAFAEETEDKEESKFNQVLLKKGSLIMKEFIDCCSFETTLSDIDPQFDIKIQTATLTDIETGSKYYALRLVTTNYRGGDFVETVGVLDSDEIDEVISTLNYIKDNLDSLKPYSEVVYTATSGFQIGAYISKDNKGIMIELNSTAQTSIDFEKIDDVVSAFEKAKAQLAAP